MDKDWYEQIPPGDHSILQGDLVGKCPIVIPPGVIAPKERILVDVELFDVVVLTQSCDLENGKAEIVLVCPLYSFQDFCKQLPAQEQSSQKAISSRFKRLKDGYEPAHHLLHKTRFSGREDFWITDFRSVYGIHFEGLKAHISSGALRIRLLSPYREHLAQAFARFMMRVGLPQNIPDLTKEEAQTYADDCKPGSATQPVTT